MLLLLSLTSVTSCTLTLEQYSRLVIIFLALTLGLLLDFKISFFNLLMVQTSYFTIFLAGPSVGIQ